MMTSSFKTNVNMGILVVLLVLATISEINANFGPVAAPSCRDCFDRRVSPGAMYWDGCHFCQCDRQVPLQSRCKTMSCQWSPCPKMKKTETEEIQATPSTQWSQWDSLGIGRK